MKGKYTPIISLAAIIAGSCGLIYILGDLVMRIILAYFCILIINYGLRLRGLPALQYLVPHFLRQFHIF